MWAGFHLLKPHVFRGTAWDFQCSCFSSGTGLGGGGGGGGVGVLGSGPEGGRTSRSSRSLAGSSNDACHCGKWSVVMKCCCCCCRFTKKPLREAARRAGCAAPRVRQESPWEADKSAAAEHTQVTQILQICSWISTSSSPQLAPLTDDPISSSRLGFAAFVGCVKGRVHRFSKVQCVRIRWKESFVRYLTIISSSYCFLYPRMGPLYLNTLNLHQERVTEVQTGQTKHLLSFYDNWRLPKGSLSCLEGEGEVRGVQPQHGTTPLDVT